MILNIDRTSRTPLFRQIIDRLRTIIDEGLIETGKALPSTRELADTLAVNRSTVTQAYEELQALGYLASHPGSYHVVVPRRREVAYDPGRESLVNWDDVVVKEVGSLFEGFSHASPERMRESSSGGAALNMARLLPDPRLYPVAAFKASLGRALAKFSANSLQYGHHRGYEPLRGFIAKRLRLHGIAVSGEEILVTNGAQQALDLVTRALAGPGRKVILESPTYALAIPLMKLNGVEILEAPMREDGMDLEVLEKLLSLHKVAFVYTIPNFQNPTGITTSHQHREKLLALCIRHQVPLVEDGFEEEMKYFGRVPLPIKSIDDHSLVIYLGTFSKTLFPGLRVGWITAERGLIDRITLLKRCTDLSSGNLTQIALHHFCTEGYYDRHLKKLHRVFRRRMDIALAGLSAHLPPEVEWQRPRGGYLIWLKLPAAFTDEMLHAHLLPHGVSVCNGSCFFSSGGASPYFRLSISALDEEEIKEGTARLGNALREMSSRGWGELS